MLAVIKTGGKQYLVQPGDKIKVEKLEAEEGSEVLFSEVLLLCPSEALAKEGAKLNVQIGNPLVENAKVTAKVLKNGKGKKLIIFKYKPKKRYKRKIGHRQTFTEVEILTIS